MADLYHLPDPLDPVHHQAAELLANGHTVKATAKRTGASEATIYRWKRHKRFTDLIESYTPASQVIRAISERKENFDLITEARNAELLLTAELRDALEQIILVIKQRLEAMTEEERDGLAIRHLSPLLKCYSDGIGILQNCHDRLTGYGMLIKELESIIESGKAQT